MSYYLGIDTSNYTTSVSVYNSSDNSIIQRKMLLPVKKGELGLRQSDAVFHHTKQLPEIIDSLFSELGTINISAVGVSSRPRNIEKSYMPCFLAGMSVARSIASINNIKLYETSHQIGHIIAALFSCNRIDLINSPFIAFHVSGGTTDCLYITPDKDSIISVEQIGTSLDLKAGQAIDRTGVMLGMKFPCGKELDALSLTSSADFNIKPSLKGNDCCLSGIENKVKKMKSDGIKNEDIAKYCIEYICETLSAMTEAAIKKLGKLPVVFAGGVMSNTIINRTLSERFGAYFAKPEFSCDNAAGIAIYSFLKESR